jgi:hypothetical protein
MKLVYSWNDDSVKLKSEIFRSSNRSTTRATFRGAKRVDGSVDIDLQPHDAALYLRFQREWNFSKENNYLPLGFGRGCSASL